MCVCLYTYVCTSVYTHTVVVLAELYDVPLVEHCLGYISNGDSRILNTDTNSTHIKKIVLNIALNFSNKFRK